MMPLLSEEDLREGERRNDGLTREVQRIRSNEVHDAHEAAESLNVWFAIHGPMVFVTLREYRTLLQEARTHLRDDAAQGIAARIDAALML